MADMEQLRQIYSRYEEQIRKVYKKSSVLDGLWGMGNDPRNHPCNSEFFENVEQWSQEFVQGKPAPEQALEAVNWILRAPGDDKNAHTYWYYYAAQIHTFDIIPFLNPDDCALLVKWYDEAFPKRDRLPNHIKLYDRLRKRAKGK